MVPTLESDIQFLKGVGEKRAKLYKKLGINSLGDLLSHYPRGYIDLSKTYDIEDAPYDEYVPIRASVVSISGARSPRRGLTYYKVIVTDYKTDLTITFFNAKYTVEALKVSQEYIFYGKVVRNFLCCEMTAPTVFPADAHGFIPLYPLTEGLTAKGISKDVKSALSICKELILDAIPFEMAEKYSLCSRQSALEMIHFPSNSEELRKAQRRIIFEELLEFALGMALTRGKTRSSFGIPMKKTDLSPFYNSLGFTPTNAQLRAIGECCEDMGKTIPMNRLLQGDVGSGKTAVAAGCIFLAKENGFQSAMMAPTEVLATQHAKTLDKLLGPLGVTVSLLTGSLSAKQKLMVKEALRNGEIDVIVGTHALIVDDVEFNSLGLIITDEQHRFGVRQRIALTKKGQSPHTLVMSATPIPRTLAYTMYGDLDVSVLDEMPKNRLPIKTYVIDPSKRDRAMGFIRGFAEKGLQSYIVCPLVEQNEMSPQSLAAAADYAEELTHNKLLGCNVGLLYGKMRPAEKDRVMQAFADNHLQVLVSTTVIEVGVDVPNAVVMLIENAERFGLSQLHQLRGRVGRGHEQSYCILVTGSEAPEAKERLKILTASNDGFEIAMQDLRLRGPGDFFGFRQHGLPILKMADMQKDMELLDLSRECVKDILKDDAHLDKPCHALLKKTVEAMLTAAMA